MYRDLRGWFYDNNTTPRLFWVTQGCGDRMYIDYVEILISYKYNYNSYLFWMKTLIAGWFTGDSYLFLDLNFDTPSPTKNKPICRKHGKLR